MSLTISNNSRRVNNYGLPVSTQNLSIPEKKLLRVFFNDDKVIPSEKIYFASVLAGVKTGCTFSYFGIDKSISEVEGYKLVNKLNLSYLYTTKEINGHILHKFFVTTGDSSLIPPFEDEQPTFTVENKYRKKYGRFLGIPEEDIAWWKKDKYDCKKGIPHRLIERCTPIDEYVDIDLSKQELANAHLVPYVPEPTKEGVKRACNTGRAYKKASNHVGEVIGYDFSHILNQPSVYDTEWFSNTKL